MTRKHRCILRDGGIFESITEKDSAFALRYLLSGNMCYRVPMIVISCVTPEEDKADFSQAALQDGIKCLTQSKVELATGPSLGVSSAVDEHASTIV